MLTPEQIGFHLAQGLDDLAPTQKSVAELFDLSEDSLTNWRNGIGVKAKQFSLIFWAARHSDRLRKWIAYLIGLDVDSALDDKDITKIVRALDLARRRRDWPEVRDTIANQLKWLGVYPAGEEERVAGT